MGCRLWFYWVVGSSLFLFAGCDGELSRPSGLGDPPGSGDCFSIRPPAPAFRRLTNDQYLGTIRNILGDPELEVDLAADASLTFSELGVEKVNSSVELFVEARPPGLMEFLPCPPDGGADRGCAASFVEGLGQVAFRRPVLDSERDLLLGIYDRSVEEFGFPDALNMVAEVIFQSPQMLYLHETGTLTEGGDGDTVPLSGFERATRLSLLLWGTGPDRTLVERAARGELDSAEGVGALVREYLLGDRTREHIRNQVVAMLELDGSESHASLDEATKDPERFGEVSPAQRKAMREEVEAFVEWALFDSGNSLQALFTSRRAFINDELAARYGVAPPTEGEWGWVELPPDQRAGILTRLAFLATFSHGDYQSPILRGAFLRDRFFCSPVGPPPPDVDDTPVAGGDSNSEASAIRSVRELTTARTGEGACRACHQLFNPIGFALEHYDAMGQWQLEEEHLNILGGQTSVPVDALGDAPNTDIEGEFYGGVELSERMAESPQVQACLTNRWIRLALSSTQVRADSCIARELQERLSNTGDLLEVIVAIAESPLFLSIAASERGAS